MNNLRLIFVFLIFFYSCKKENATIENDFQNIRVYPGEIVASDSRSSSNTLSGIVRINDEFHFEYYDVEKRFSVVLPFSNYSISDSVKIYYQFNNYYYLDLEDNSLYLTYYTQGMLNGNVQSSYNSRISMAKIDLDNGNILWQKEVYDFSYFNNFILGVSQNKLQTISNFYLGFFNHTYYYNFDKSSGVTIDSVFSPAIQFIQESVKLEGKIFVLDYSLTSLAGWKLRIFDENFISISDYSIDLNLINGLAKGLYIGLPDSLVLLSGHYDYEFPAIKLNLESGLTTYFQYQIPTISNSIKYHKIDNGNFIEFGYTGVGENQSSMIFGQNAMYIPYADSKLAFAEYDHQSNSFLNYKEFKYQNGLHYLNSIYLGDKKFQILANTGTQFESQQNHIVFEIDLDNSNQE